MRFQNKVALITGGNFGIGRGIANKFADEGATVAIVARNKDRADIVVEEITQRGSTAVFYRADVSDERSVMDMIDAVINRFEKINIVVNNAGCGSQH